MKCVALATTVILQVRPSRFLHLLQAVDITMSTDGYMAQRLQLFPPAALPAWRSCLACSLCKKEQGEVKQALFVDLISGL